MPRRDLVWCFLFYVLVFRGTRSGQSGSVASGSVRLRRWSLQGQEPRRWSLQGQEPRRPEIFWSEGRQKDDQRGILPLNSGACRDKGSLRRPASVKSRCSVKPRRVSETRSVAGPPVEASGPGPQEPGRPAGSVYNGPALVTRNTRDPWRQ